MFYFEIQRFLIKFDLGIYYDKMNYITFKTRAKMLKKLLML